MLRSRLRRGIVPWILIALLFFATPALAFTPRDAESSALAPRVAPAPAPVAPPALRSPQLSEPDPAIAAILDLVLADDLYAIVGDLSGEWPVTIGGEPHTILTRHSYSGEGIQKATEYVFERLAALGLEMERQVWGEANQPNIIGQITGRTRPGEVYLICAHVDDQPEGPRAPGADDNASGCAAVLVAAEILSQFEWDVTLRFGLWTAEEQGLFGSKAYAQRAQSRGEDLRAVINVDMIGYDGDGIPEINVETTAEVPGAQELAELLIDVVREYGLDLIPELIVDGSLRTRSDTWSFWQSGFPAILAIEDYYGDFNTRYHTVNDLLVYLDMDYFTAYTKAAIGALAHAAGGPRPVVQPTPTEVPVVFILALPVLVK